MRINHKIRKNPIPLILSISAHFGKCANICVKGKAQGLPRKRKVSEKRREARSFFNGAAAKSAEVFIKASEAVDF